MIKILLITQPSASQIAAQNSLEAIERARKAHEALMEEQRKRVLESQQKAQKEFEEKNRRAIAKQIAEQTRMLEETRRRQNELQRQSREHSREVYYNYLREQEKRAGGHLSGYSGLPTSTARANPPDRIRILLWQ